MNFEEQIDKSNYYSNQFGRGGPQIKLYRRAPRQRGSGFFSSLIKRFAFPIGRELVNQALPLVQNVVRDVAPEFNKAKNTVKSKAAQVLRNLGTQIEQSGIGKKRKIKPRVGRIKVMKGSGKRKKVKSKQCGGKKRVKKTIKPRKSQKVFDIFK